MNTNICGVLVHANPKRIDDVLEALRGLEGVEVHDTAAGARVVITIEDTAARNAIDTLGDVHRIEGVVAASLVYHHFEPAEDIGPSH